jgi:uncharacterized membrane protein YphA (DoxX/SURF4 family)
MNILLWVLQILTALLYAWSGYMKIFQIDELKQEVPTFAALPKDVWVALGVVELVCVAGLILPSALRWKPSLTVVAAAILACESLIFVWVHVQYRETPPLIMSAVLGLLMAFIAYGRKVWKPLS